ncbi:MAG: hypothetical protein HZC15_02930 [Candidatus Omnitrophica bacterium]|nr:hypothetical protein [Candidatus Omnitrophota bacterium]
MNAKILLKNLMKGGEVKMKKVILVMLVVFVLAVGSCYAANTQTINVTATVAAVANGLNVGISKIDSKGTCVATDDSWTSGQAGVAFGTLNWDAANSIFLNNYYYAVDVGVVDNSGAAWTITHTRTDFKKDATNNLNSNVNVTFAKQTDATTGSDLSKVSYANSNNVSYTKAQLAGGWLRVYYGIGTGDVRVGCTDAAGVTPITVDKPAGAYSGTVTLTLTGV